MEVAKSRQPHLAILPSQGMGHLIPLAELSKLLVDRYNFTVTIITFAASDNKATQNFLSTLPSSINSISLPPIPLEEIPSDTSIEAQMSIASIRSLPALRSILVNLQSTTNLIAFIADFFTTDGVSIARNLGILPYLFFGANLQALTLMLELPALLAAVNCSFQDLKEPIKLPGCIPFSGSEIVAPLRNRSNDAYKWILHHAAAAQHRQVEGILVNSFAAIEPGSAMHFTKEEDCSRPPVYPVGPIIRDSSAAGCAAPCLKWLDKQPEGSVLFVSFGSGGALTRKQLEELALGLEASKQRFLLVVRSPCDDNASSGYLTANTKDNPLVYLPHGFLERTKDVGFVVTSWAPQIEVLGHSSTGGFLSHCGWSSTLESVASGVPMIAWPLFAEQSMNAVMLVEGVGIAIRPESREDGMIDREEIARVVKKLMEGEEGKCLSNRVEALKKAATAAAGEGGSSYKALDEVANKWKSFSV